MKVLLIIGMFITGLLLWLLLAPFIITIDNKQQIYELRWLSIGHLKLNFENEQILLQFRLLFYRNIKNIDLFKLMTSKQDIKPKEEKKKKRKKPVSWEKIKHKAINLFKSFTLKKLWLNIDTDSYYYNAFLYPVFFFLKGKNYRMNINYQGENELSLVLKNRPIRIVFALLF